MKNTNKQKVSSLLSSSLRVDDGTKEWKQCLCDSTYKQGHDTTCQQSQKYVGGGSIVVNSGDKNKDNTITIIITIINIKSKKKNNRSLV